MTLPLVLLGSCHASQWPAQENLLSEFSLCCAGPILGFSEPRRGSLDVLVKFGDFLVSNSVWFLSSISFLQLTAAQMNAIDIMYSSRVDFWYTIFDITYYVLMILQQQSYKDIMLVQLWTVVNSQYSGSSLTSQFKLAEEETWLNWRWDVIDFPTRAET